MRDAESKASQRRERNITELSATISSKLNGIEEVSHQQRQLEAEYESILRSTQRHKNESKRLEQRIEELAEVRKKDVQDLEETKQRRATLYEEEVKRIHSLREKESERLRKRASQVQMFSRGHRLSMSSHLEPVSESQIEGSSQVNSSSASSTSS